MSQRDSLDPLREELVASLYSDNQAQARLGARTSNPEFADQLAQVCYPYDFYSNDPRMEAAYYLSKCSIGSLEAVAPKIEQLLQLPDDGETMNTNISVHLVNCIRRLVSESGYRPAPQIAALLAS